MCELVEHLIEENKAFAADIAAGFDPVVCFDGHYVAWDVIVDACGNGVYGNSPLELIGEIINERDGLKKSDETFRKVIKKLRDDNHGMVPNWLIDLAP